MTGGIGMGKSTAADLLRKRGLPVVDTDILAREVVEPGQPGLDEIKTLFGADVIGSDGRLRRDELAARVFADDTKRRQLEAITHPRIRERWMAQAESWRAQGRPMGVVVIPLLFETGAEACFDAILCVACSSATQHRRLEARGWTPLQIEQRLRAQWPIEKKMAASNYVVWTEGALDAQAEQLARIVAAEGRSG
ncbi:MAG TPA: dephospho-CoA kinase [Verrucomicrobiae bacterium]